MSKKKEFVVLDSGERENFDTGAVRDTCKRKGRPSLIPAHPLLRLANHYENGSMKYADHNWAKGMPISRYIDSLYRHLFKYMGGDRTEDHLAAIAWNVFAIMDHEERISRGLLPDELNDIKNWPKSFLDDEFLGELGDNEKEK